MSVNVNSSADLRPVAGYELMYEEYLGDIKTAGMVFRHVKSGARVCILSNDDENKMFCAAFRTPVFNDTGVPHICEHTVLNGSKNFPSRDPFMQLVKGSLNTFLNAMTYPDKTLYPVASCNDKDFKNLMNVYMDAVFYPNIYKHREIFMQEGWHYELENKDDNLKVNGVVYSEMKGATSDPYSCLYEELGKVMYPDATYGKNSGGAPEAIPTLSYEDFLEFHRSHYHPSNSYIFVYGNVDVEERLEWMDKNYLSEFDAIDPHSEVVPQKHFGEKTPKKVIAKYPVGTEDETEGKSYMLYSTLCNSAQDALVSEAWDHIADVLIYSQGAPLKQALLDAGIGTEISGGYDTHQVDNSFSISVKDAKSEDFDKFYEIIRSVLTEQVEKGLNEKALLASINNDEFRFREADYGGYPRGLDYAADMLKSWLYNDDAAFNYMHDLDTFAQLRAKIGTGFYEDLIRKYILESDHSVLCMIEPERGLVDKKNAELDKKLADYKASLTDEQIEKIINDTKQLREYQSHEPTEEELTCIPVLERSDISPEAAVKFSNIETEIAGVKTVKHDYNANGITYADFVFDIEGIPTKYLPYVGFIGAVLSNVSTAKRSYSELDIDKKLNIGQLGFGHHEYGQVSDYKKSKKTYEVSFRALSEKVSYAVDMDAEILTSSDLGDKKRLKEILGEVRANGQSRMMNSGNSVGIHRATSYFSSLAAYQEMIDGVDYYMFIKDMYENFDAKSDELVAGLRAVASVMFNPDRLLLSITSDETGMKQMTESLPAFISALRDVKPADLGECDEIVPVKKNEGLMVASQVQYVCMAGNIYDCGFKYDGSYKVIDNKINNDYMYQQIRVQGGAYGYGLNINKLTGNTVFYSYRDPQLKKTKAVYEGIGDFVRSAVPTYSDLTTALIGAFSPSERPSSPAGRTYNSLAAYMTGMTDDDVNRERMEMLATTPEQYSSVADMFDAVVKQGYFCVVGNEANIRENKDLFDNIISIN